VRYEPGAVGKGRPLIEKIMEWMPAYAAAHVTGVRTPDGRETEGWFIGAPFMPEQMLALPREKVYRKILDAIELGASFGAEIVGLGAFTGVVGDAGITLAERSPIPVTTGNSLTIAAGVASLLRGAREMEVELAGATAVVIGATGSIGSACVELIAPYVAHVVLVARNRTRLEKFVASLRDRVSCALSISTDVRDSVPRGQLVLTATSSTQELIDPADLQTGAVVCELSLPHDVGRRVAIERPDVLVTEGGNMLVPGTPRFARVREEGRDFDLGLPPGTALACMSETMVLALENRRENYTLGRGIDLERVREIDALATRAGFSLATMRAFDAAVTPERIAEIKAAAIGRREARMTGREREHHYAATVRWIGPQAGSTTTYAGYSRRHTVSFEGKNVELSGSADAAFRGEADLVNPEELLLASLAACHMLAYLALCARNGIEVVSYVDRSAGTMSERGGVGRFVSARLAPVVRVSRPEDIANAVSLHERAHAECFIANSVNFPDVCAPDVAIENERVYDFQK